MSKLIALNGRALFEHDDVSIETDGPNGTGPYYAWMLFTWYVNEMVPETFATDDKGINILNDTPAHGWTTEEYKTARIMLPPLDSGNMIMIQADDPRLYPIWDAAMQKVVAGGIHKH